MTPCGVAPVASSPVSSLQEQMRASPLGEERQRANATGLITRQRACSSWTPRHRGVRHQHCAAAHRRWVARDQWTNAHGDAVGRQW
jgi:hypothetical protein